MQELEILQSKETREQMINKVEVLEKVKDLLLLGNSEFATTEQVANYYEVGLEAINSIIKENRDELESDGFKKFKKSDILRNVLEGHNVRNERTRSLVVIDGKEIAINNTGLNLFSKRSILRVGMLLRDSEIAKEIRTRLLDIEYESNNVIQENRKSLKQNIINEISEEKQLMLDRVEAEMNGDYSKVCEINSQLFALKNKRIVELENKVKNITTHSLTLVESRNVINKLVRLIAIKEYRGIFGKAYGDLYKTVNYKLGINIKARDKKKSESYLDTLTENECYGVEEIARVWANDCDVNVEKELSLAV